MTQKQRIEFDQRRELILEAVAPLFARKGLLATTKELAAAAGVSEALIYKHFDSKEALFSSVKEICCRGVDTVAEEILKRETLKEQLVLSMVLTAYAFLVGMDEEVLPKSEIYRLVSQSLASDGDFALEMFSDFSQWVDPVSEIMDGARKEGWLKKSTLTNKELIWMSHHFMLGMSLTTVPNSKLKIFKVWPIELVKKCSIQLLILLGMEQGQVPELVQAALKEIELIKKTKENDATIKTPEEKP